MAQFNRLTSILAGKLGGAVVLTAACALAACGDSGADNTPAGGGGASGAGVVLSSGGSAGSMLMAGSGEGAPAGAGGSAGTSMGTLDAGSSSAGSDGGAGDGSVAIATTACTAVLFFTAAATTETFDFGGRSRDYVVHVPTGYDGGKRVPLVVDLHGYTSWATEQASRTKWGAKADAEGFIVIDPDGVDKSWNATICCGTAQSSMIDDVAFMRAVVARVSGALCIDPRRVYLSGHSNGAMMTFVLGCQAADLFAAIAPVAGVTPDPSTCHPSR